MSLKNRDEHNRWRNKTIAFRVSPEENEQIEHYVKLSGLTKQDYITRRLTHKDVVVHGSPRVYKSLRNQFAAVLDELRRIEAGVFPVYGLLCGRVRAGVPCALALPLLRQAPRPQRRRELPTLRKKSPVPRPQPDLKGSPPMGRFPLSGGNVPKGQKG